MTSKITYSTSMSQLSRFEDLLSFEEIGSDYQCELDFSKMIDDIVLSDEDEHTDSKCQSQEEPRSLVLDLNKISLINNTWSSVSTVPYFHINNSYNSPGYIYHSPVSVSASANSFLADKSSNAFTHSTPTKTSSVALNRFENTTNNPISNISIHKQNPVSNKSVFIGSSNYSNFLDDSANFVLSPPGIFIPPGSKFFVIKSFNEQDVRSSFIHKVWTSTELGNKRLNKAYKMKKPNERIFFFFSVNGSGKFSGVAEMKSSVKKDVELKYNSIWVENSKYRGYFQIQWVFVKDIKNSSLKHLKNRSNDFKPVTISRDTQEVPFEIGLEIIKTFKKTCSTTSFLQNL